MRWAIGLDEYPRIEFLLLKTNPSDVCAFGLFGWGVGSQIVPNGWDDALIAALLIEFAFVIDKCVHDVGARYQFPGGVVLGDHGHWNDGQDANNKDFGCVFH